MLLIPALEPHFDGGAAYLWDVSTIDIECTHLWKNKFNAVGFFINKPWEKG
jgi:hypothetical protein